MVVPCGWVLDKLRRYSAVTSLGREMGASGEIIGFICHNGLASISAGTIRDHRTTGSLGVKNDLVNAGAIWVDVPAFREGNLTWGCVVADIPDYYRELVAALVKVAQEV